MASFSSSCPQCGSPWEVRPSLLGKVASDFGSCAFRCLSCGIAFSNAKDPRARRRITAKPQLNVPAQARAELDEVLRGAINVDNRTAKYQKFCSESSEDAVTWTVVTGLRETDGLGALVGEPQRRKPQALLLWGHPTDGTRSGELQDALIALSDRLGENPNRRSEPDVIVLWADLLVFVEAKYRGDNDRQPGYGGYKTYLPAPGCFCADDEAVRAEGSYQLIRNWVIGSALADAQHLPFALVNLGPSSIAQGAAEFATLLHQTPDRRFEHRTWLQVLGSGPIPGWLADYATSLGLK